MAFVIAIQVGDQLEFLPPSEPFGCFGDVLSRVRRLFPLVQKTLVKLRAGRADPAGDTGVNDDVIDSLTAMLHACGSGGR